MQMQMPVKMYTLSTCSHCKATKSFMTDNGISFDFVDVDLLEGDERDAIIKEVKEINPRCTFPTMVIGDQVIIGFREDKVREALGL